MPRYVFFVKKLPMPFWLPFGGAGAAFFIGAAFGAGTSAFFLAVDEEVAFGFFPAAGAFVGSGSSSSTDSYSE
jgi:hypothetical protein